MTHSRHPLPRREPGPLPAVRPSVVLAATVFAGVWLGWPWFVFNAFALGLEDKRRLAKRLAVGLAGATALAFVVVALPEPGDMAPSLVGLVMDEPRPFTWIPYVIITLIGWKSTTAYLLFEDQRRSAEVYEYYGGTLRNGLPLVAAGAFLRSWILIELLPVGWWTLVLA